jgi:hypothetical protein
VRDAAGAVPRVRGLRGDPGGRYARIFVGLNDGWVKGAGEPATLEEVAANFESIRDPEGYVIPTSTADDLQKVGRVLKGDVSIKRPGR